MAAVLRRCVDEADPDPVRRRAAVAAHRDGLALHLPETDAAVRGAEPLLDLGPHELPVDPEPAPPLEDEREGVAARVAGRPVNPRGRLQLAQLPDVVAPPQLRRPAPELGEVVHLRNRGRDAGQIDVDRRNERCQRLRVTRLPDDDVVRRGLHCRGAVRDPEVRFGEEVRQVAHVARDSEHQVVPRLVGEQQRPGALEKLGRVHSSSSTSTTPLATRTPSLTWPARTVASYGETSGVSIFIASSTTSGCRAVTRAPASVRTLTTVPGIGATRDDCSPASRCAVAAPSTVGTGLGGGAPGFNRQAPLHGAPGATVATSLNGGCSVRNAVVVRPARTSGCAASQRRNARFVVTPATSVSRNAALSRSYASARVSPYAMSFAISGSYDVPISSPSATPASTRIPLGSRSRSMRPACGRNVRGSSAYRRTSTACPSKVDRATSSAPRAIRNCSRTRSTPVTSSVTGCSTWMRAFSSRK